MVDHLSGETALEVEDQRDAPQTTEGIAYQGTFVQMGMDHVWLVAQGAAERGDG
jgi:hypothetical protein